MSERFHQLDSLRGLAALSVVTCHVFECWPALFKLVEGADAGQFAWLCLPPIYLLWAGHVAVLLFFVLSGFVLALPFLSSYEKGLADAPYGQYLLKRVCRIYVPYLACVLLVMVLAHSLPLRPLEGVSGMISGVWQQPLTPKLFWQHVILVLPFDTMTYNGVIWTLMFEMRISLVFPLIAWVVIRSNWLASLGYAAGLAAVGVLAAQVFRQQHALADLMFTTAYAGMFMVGATLAKYRRPLLARVSGCGAAWRTALVAAALLLLCSEALAYVFQTRRIGHVLEMGTVAGSCLAILLAMTSRAMEWRPLAWLGRVSYSLYLWHMPVVLVVFHLGYGRVPTGVLIGLVYVLSLGTAAFMHRWIEVRATALPGVVNAALRRRLPIVKTGPVTATT